MRTYTIVKTYKIYEGGGVSGESVDDLDGVRLLAWLKARGYSYEQVEQLLTRLNDSGSVRVQVPAKDTKS